MAFAAEMLRRRRHALRPLMLGVAIDAAARRQVDRLLEGELDPAPAAEVRPSPREPERIGMAVNVRVTRDAGRVADRFERLHMAGAAIVLERGMGLRQMTARPDFVGLEA